MLPYYWPCHVRRQEDGFYRVTPFNAQECCGAGTTLKEASDHAKAALSDQIMRRMTGKEEFLWPPTHMIDDKALVSGSVVRIKVEISS